MKRAIFACLAVIALCAGCIFDDFAFDDCECDETNFSSPSSK